MSSFSTEAAIQPTLAGIAGATSSLLYHTSPYTGAALCATAAAVQGLLMSSNYSTINHATETIFPLAFSAVIMKTNPNLTFHKCIQIWAASICAYNIMHQLIVHTPFKQPPPDLRHIITSTAAHTALLTHSRKSLTYSTLTAIGWQTTFLFIQSTTKTFLSDTALCLTYASLAYLPPHFRSLSLATYSAVLSDAFTHLGIYLWSHSAIALASSLAGKAIAPLKPKEQK